MVPLHPLQSYFVSIVIFLCFPRACGVSFVVVHMSFLPMPLSRANREVHQTSLEEIRKGLFEEFKKLNSEAQHITKLKEIK